MSQQDHNEQRQGSSTVITIVTDTEASIPSVEFRSGVNYDNNNDPPLAPNVCGEDIAVHTLRHNSINPETLSVRLTALEEQCQRQQRLDNNNNSNNIERNQRDCPQENNGVFEYTKEYPISRFQRKWKRPEVQGFCCVAVEIICLAILAVLSLRGVGYLGPGRSNGHLPLTFSWKILWQFFGNMVVPKELIDCLYSNLDGKIIMHTEESLSGLESGGGSLGFVLIDRISPSSTTDNEGTKVIQDSVGTSFHGSRSPSSMKHIFDKQRCEFSEGRYSLNWLGRFFFCIHCMPLLNILTSSILYISVSVRRRKGIQILLLLPAFFCFFVSIFQQIPISFQYSYFDQSLIKEMTHALRQSKPPFYVVPILDETQVHRQCCGVEVPETWEAFGFGDYPLSCCNTTAFNCAKLDTVNREHVWSQGCFQLEHDFTHTFERWALFLYAMKVIAEVGIFCTLSDLTRFDYPPPEVVETSRCDFRDYQVKCRGVMHIKGVTKDGRIVVESRYFLPWRLIPSRTDLLNGLQLNLKTDQNLVKGSVEVVKRYNVASFVGEDLQVDLSRKNRGIFVFTLM